jgi:hypothetical protein
MKTLLVMLTLVISLIVAGIFALFEDNTTTLIAVICAWNPALIALGWSIHHAGAYVRFGWGRSNVRQRTRKPKRQSIEKLLQEEF